jgi:hypothetical protein
MQGSFRGAVDTAIAGRLLVNSSAAELKEAPTKAVNDAVKLGRVGTSRCVIVE